MRLNLRLGPEPGPLWDLAKQLGVDHATMNLPTPDGDAAPWAYESLRRMQERANDRGLEVQVIEERPPMDAIRLGREGREAEFDAVRELVENMGELDIPVWCWSWRAHFPVIRTGTVTLRGGSRATAYNHQQLDGHLEGDPLVETAPTVSEAELWGNLEWFLDRIVPVAEEAGVKLALHPDDPPIDGDVAGTSRIITSVEAYDRVLDAHDSEHNGVCLPQGNLSAMGADVPATIRRFGDRIHFAHFRDVRGDAGNFYETWHDNGQTDMHAAVEAYRDVGFDGPIRPDHYTDVTASDGERTGRAYAIAYMRGLLESVGVDA